MVLLIKIEEMTFGGLYEGKYSYSKTQRTRV